MGAEPEEVEKEQEAPEERQPELEVDPAEPGEKEETPSVSATAGNANPEVLNLQNEIKKWKTFARRHESRAKENYEKLQEFEDAQKSDIEKLSERAARAEKEREDATLQVARMQIAVDKKLSMKEAKRLQGSTVEELEEDAEDLIELLREREAAKQKAEAEEDSEEERPKPKPKKKSATPRKRPKERLRPGAVSPGSESDTRSGEEIAAAVLKRSRGY